MEPPKMTLEEFLDEAAKTGHEYEMTFPNGDKMTLPPSKAFKPPRRTVDLEEFMAQVKEGDVYELTFPDGRKVSLGPAKAPRK